MPASTSPGTKGRSIGCCWPTPANLKEHAEYGTGSLVAPGVLLTNHHVLPDANVAKASAIEFDFEDGPDGQPRQSHHRGHES
jgi:hypothetical protein